MLVFQQRKLPKGEVYPKLILLIEQRDHHFHINAINTQVIICLGFVIYKSGYKRDAAWAGGNLSAQFFHMNLGNVSVAG